MTVSSLRYAFFHVNRFPRYILRVFFQFDKWHISSLAERKYAKDIITFLNSLPKEERKRLAEIGSGLGDIIRNVRFLEKNGLDADANVIKAASFLSFVTFDKTRYSKFLFPSSVLQGKWNAIVIVNWIHHIEPKVLKESIEQYFSANLLSGGCIVVDTVQAKNYKYNHNISYLITNLSCDLVKIGDYENQREIFAIFNR